MSIIKDAANNKVSSKRVIGIALIAIQQIIYVVKELSDKEIVNIEVFIGLVCTGGALLGAAILEYFSLAKKLNPKQ